MRPLRFRYWWLSGGILLIAAVLYLTLMPMSVVRGLSAGVNDKFAHFVAFFTLMFWFSGIYERRQWLVVALALAALGAGIELIQGQLGYRSAERADLLYDIVGIGIAWTGAWLGLGRWAQQVESLGSST